MPVVVQKQALEYLCQLTVPQCRVAGTGWCKIGCMPLVCCCQHWSGFWQLVDAIVCRRYHCKGHVCTETSRIWKQRAFDHLQISSCLPALTNAIAIVIVLD